MWVLSERVVTEFSGMHPFLWWWIGGLLPTVGIIIALVVLEKIFDFITDGKIATTLVAIVIIGIVGLIMVTPACRQIGDPKTKTEYVEYKVTLEDSVSYNVFTEQYEVLNVEGEILTVRKRDDK